MAELAFGAIGAGIAAATGGGLLAGVQYGISAGTMLFGGSMQPRQIIGKLQDVSLSGSNVGVSIPIVFGTVRIGGNIIYAPGLKELKKSGGGGKRPRSTNYSYTATFASMICAGPIVKVRKIFADADVIYDDTGGSLVVHKSIDPDMVRIYLGTNSQAIDPVESSEHGAEATAYRNRAYVMFEALNLNAFGSRIPNLSFEVDAGAATLEDICTKLAELSGLASSQFDFSALSAIGVTGFVAAERKPLKDYLEELASVYLVDFVEVDGQVKGIPRGGANSFAISWSDFGASLSEPKSPRLEVSRMMEVEIPQEITISYSSAANNYQVMTQQASRITRTAQGQPAITTTAVLSDSFARQVAMASLYSKWAGRIAYSSSLSTKWGLITAGDCGTIETPAGSKRIRIIDQTFEGVSVISFNGVEDNASAYSQNLAGAVPDVPEPEVTGVGEPVWEVFDVNSPWPENTDFTFAILGAGSDAVGWSGGQINADGTGGLPSSIGTYFNSPSIIGVTTTTLGTGIPGLIDEIATVDVQLEGGSLASVSTEQLLYGANLAIIGQELIHFRSAVLVSPSVWRLSGLIRGVRGSEWAISGHSTGDTFLLLVDEELNRFAEISFNSPAQVQHWPYSSALAVDGTTLSHRLIEGDTDYSAGLPTLKTTVLNGNSRRPWAPVNLNGIRSGSDAVLTWVRRARINNDLVDLTDVPLDEISELYDIEIYDATGLTLVRTVSGLSSPTYTYTAAQQVTDLGAVAPFKFKAFQVTTYAGLGRGFGSTLADVS